MSIMMKDIAVLFDASPEGQHLLNIAVELAETLHSHIIAITAQPHVPTHPHEAFAVGAALSEVIARQRSALVASSLEMSEKLNEALLRSSASGELRIISNAESSSESSLHALYCDLLVIGHPDIPGTPLMWSTHQILRQTGTPILVVPRSWQKTSIGENVLVAWNGSRQARRAIADALPILANAREVTLLVVDPEQKADVHGDQPGADMAAYLVRHHVKVNLVVTTSKGHTVADVIINRARFSQCDLLVFGAYSRLRASEVLFGGVTRTLLMEVPMPLLVSQ
ncbi:TPA: universal stress protein [Pseudomonas aeruginosa]|nr:universal stress protein [Pseudomonas aeruginosa]HEH8432036.1 universal stress protein [Pseudomonas aeruginosa]HEH8533587.1 universal stress protein [Pseudomonas aeruginosa]HEH8759614.1 universal stress protein [Pseudomonas aeruginosa]